MTLAINSAQAGPLYFSTRGQKETAVLCAFALAGKDGLTDQECQTACKLSGNTERPRRRQLEKLGYVVRTPKTRRTAAKKWALVFKITPEGRKEMKRRQALKQAA